MRLRSWRGTEPLSTSTRRPFPWVRLTLFLAIVGVVAYIFVPNLLYIRADALVQGNLVPVTSIYRVRVDNLLVSCNDRVRAGQPVAIVSNFIVQADYQREYLQSAQQQQLSQIALDQNIAEARDNAEALHQRYVASQTDLQRVADTARSYEQAYAEGAIPRIDLSDKETELRADRSQTASALEAWQRARQHVNVVQKDASSKLESDRQLSSQAQSLAQQVSRQPLYAPVSGYIVDCVGRPQNVIDAGVHLFDIYAPDRSYILAYFDPNTVNDVQIGQVARISIAGVPNMATGHVVAIYPNLSKLPSQLTRFFWQHVQFSEYRPVKIAIDHISKADREKLYYDAQARIYIDRGARSGASPAAVSVHP